jgi:FKBP-type peptidyl-prolyl cis-trans isomerase FklB
MKKVLISSVFLFTAVIYVAAQNGTKVVKKTSSKAPAKVKAPMFNNLLDSFSYAAGFNVATNMKTQGISKLNVALMQKGLDDVFKNNKPVIAAEVGSNCIQKQMQIFTEEKAMADKAKGVAFLEANKKRKEVITLPSGLQYEVIKNGDANSLTPTTADTVVVNYRVALFDGEDIENSFKSGQPAVFPVTGVIKGWIEILQLMRKGDHWKVYVPSELAYDAAGKGASIPPYSTLKFEMLLEEIRPFVAKTPGQ